MPTLSVRLASSVEDSIYIAPAVQTLSEVITRVGLVSFVKYSCLRMEVGVRGRNCCLFFFPCVYFLLPAFEPTNWTPPSFAETSEGGG